MKIFLKIGILILIAVSCKQKETEKRVDSESEINYYTYPFYYADIFKF